MTGHKYLIQSEQLPILIYPIVIGLHRSNYVGISGLLIRYKVF